MVKAGAVGTIERWDAEARAGVIRLDDGEEARFVGGACGSPYGGGCTPRPGLRVRIARVSADDPELALLVNPLGARTHGKSKRAPFRGTITELRGSGDGAFGLVAGIGFFGRCCIGFAPAIGLEVWVYDLVAESTETRAQTLFALDRTPDDTQATSDAARAEEASVREAAQAHAREIERRKREPNAEDVRTMLAEIAARGGRVVGEPPSSLDEVADVEASLGRALPTGYRKLVTEVGGFSLMFYPYKNVYGPKDALAMAKHLADTVFRPTGDPGRYVPRRFLVLADDGEHARPGDAMVYDAELGGLLDTSATEPMYREDAYDRDVWEWVIGELDRALSRLPPAFVPAPDDTEALDEAARADEADVRASREAHAREITRRQNEPNVEDVRAMLAEIAARGVPVEMDPPSSHADVDRAEASLGFALPAEYRKLVTELGGFSLGGAEHGHVYGLEAALARTAVYTRIFDESRRYPELYYPRRFLVVFDEEDWTNEGEGVVYDADLAALLPTMGHESVREKDAYPFGFWQWLIGYLDQVEAGR